MPIYCDEQRQADHDNPAGYYEHESVKSLAKDASWLSTAAGRAIKIVAPLVPSIPTGLPLRVLLIDRDLDEVLASQSKMMERLGTTGAALPKERLKAVFHQQWARAKAILIDRPEAAVLEVAYPQIVSDPATMSNRMNAFLGGGLDEAAMAAAVDPQLYRNRQS